MRTSYWSNSVFAEKIRKIAGIPIQPISATMGGWEEYETAAKNASTLGYNLIEFLDTIQRAVYWIPDKFDACIYYISNLKSGSHYLKTRTKRGQWSDLVTKIPDALMLSVIDFVEKECFWMNIMGAEDGILKEYANQSYISRKLFPIHISDTVRGKEGIKWLLWQIEASDGHEQTRDCYTEVIAAYKFAKERYFKFDVWEESGYNEAERAGVYTTAFKDSGKRFSYYTKIRELETEFDQQTTLHCVNIVKNRQGLWT